MPDVFPPLITSLGTPTQYPIFLSAPSGTSGTLTIEVQVSTTGFSDTSFTPLFTANDDGSGVYFYQQTVRDPVQPTVAGQLYFYRARRRDSSQPVAYQYSDWVYAVARAPYPLSAFGGSLMPDPIIGARSSVGIALESTEGVAVKAIKLLEVTSFSVTRGLPNLYSKALRNTTASRMKNIDGPSTFTGQMTVEITPEGGFPYLLVGLMGTPTTTQMGGAAGTPAFFRHAFYDTFGRQTATLIHQKGSQYYVYRGVTFNSYTESVDPKQNDVMVANVGFMALDEQAYSTASQVGMDTASVDSNKPFAAVDGIVYVAGTPSLKVDTAEVTIENNVREKRVLWGYRGPVQHFYGRSNNSARLTAYLTDGDNEFLSRTFGTPSFTLPVGPARNQVPTEVRVTWNTGANAPKNPLNFVNSRQIVFPQAVFDAVDDPVTSPDEVKQTVSLMPMLDQGTGTDVYILFDNSMNYATITQTGTAISPVPNDSIHN